MFVYLVVCVVYVNLRCVIIWHWHPFVILELMSFTNDSLEWDGKTHGSLRFAFRRYIRLVILSTKIKLSSRSWNMIISHLPMHMKNNHFKRSPYAVILWKNNRILHIDINWRFGRNQDKKREWAIFECDSVCATWSGGKRLGKLYRVYHIYRSEKTWIDWSYC